MHCGLFVISYVFDFAVGAFHEAPLPPSLREVARLAVTEGVILSHSPLVANGNSPSQSGPFREIRESPLPVFISHNTNNFQP